MLLYYVEDIANSYVILQYFYYTTRCIIGKIKINTIM